MATPTAGTSHKEVLRHVDQFFAQEPNLNDAIESILVEYSGIPSGELVSHLKNVRDKAWTIFKYPCIGRWGFLDLSIAQAPQYGLVLERLRDGETLLDLGCCFGQDVRKIVFDGAPAAGISAIELEKSFIDLGFDLFNDRGKLNSTFISADFFAPNIKGLDDRSFDMIYAASFFHLFTWTEQMEAMSKTMRLLKPKAGSMIFGRQTGAAEAGVVKLDAYRSGEAYRHNKESWKKLVREVAHDLGIEVDVDCGSEQVGDWIHDGHEIFLFRFAITRL